MTSINLAADQPRPHDDFYRSINGEWINTYELPADRSRFGAFDKLAEDSEKAVATMDEVKEIMDAQNEKVLRAGEAFSQVKAGIDASIKGVEAIEEKTIKLDDARANVIDIVQNLTAIAEENKFEYPNCDGLIINKKDTAIYLNFADCTPIILYDPINNIGAVSHAGWRGTAANIASKTVLKMKEKFNSNPEDIIALIGPCISFEHFETSDEAIEKSAFAAAALSSFSAINLFVKN